MSLRQKYYLKQKLWGVVAIILGCVSPYILEGDATFGLMLVPMGLVLLFTKELLWDDEYSREVERRGLKLRDYR